MSRIINITEAKAQLSRLVDQAAAGQHVVLGKAGRPLAVLVPYAESPPPRELGAWAGRVWIAEDFDAPLAEHVQATFEALGE
jgi:prevent-host-death family protein